MPPSAVQPSDLELQILSLLWDSGPMTARQVLESLPDKKPRAYTSVLSVMQVMEKKGLLTHSTIGNVYLYRAKVARAKILGGLMKRLIQQVFAGNPATAIQYLLREGKVSARELREIQELLDQHGREQSTSQKERDI